MFMARKGDQVAFFLPVTHKASDVEMDSYLRVVEEVMDRSTVVYDESARMEHIYTFAMHACAKKIQLPKSTQDLLDATFNYISTYDEFRFPAVELLQEPDFAKLMIVLLGPLDRNVEDIPNFDARSVPLASFLADKYGRTRRSIETMKEFHTNYCALSHGEKRSTVEAAVRSFKNFKINTKDEASIRYRGWLACIKSTISDASIAGNRIGKSPTCNRNADNFRKGIEKFLLSLRNEQWLENIQRIGSQPGVPFYALGAEHFTRNTFGPGLLTLLERSGYKVSLIESTKDLPPELHGKISAKHTEPVLAGAEWNKEDE